MHVLIIHPCHIYGLLFYVYKQRVCCHTPVRALPIPTIFCILFKPVQHVLKQVVDQQLIRHGEFKLNCCGQSQQTASNFLLKSHHSFPGEKTCTLLSVDGTRGMLGLTLCASWISNVITNVSKLVHILGQRMGECWQLDCTSFSCLGLYNSRTPSIQSAWNESCSEGRNTDGPWLDVIMV